MTDKTALKNIKEYKRLFHHKGFRLLINYIWVKAYKGYGAVAIVKDDDYISYITKQGYERAKIEGLDLFQSEEKFDKYFSDFKKFEIEVKDFFEKIDEINKEVLEKMFEYLIKALWYYKKTEFLFTDYPYLTYEKTKDPILKKNLDKFEKIKFPARDFLSLIFIGTNSKLYGALKKIGEKVDIEADDLLQYIPEEILKLVTDGEKLSGGVVEKRKKSNVVFDHNKEAILYWGSEADKIISDFYSGMDQDNLIKGKIANKGKAKGHVKILNPGYEKFHSIGEEIDKMNKGDVLVSETTSPELVPACKKASAIVTDQGGLISHAAIISRELNIPCIVEVGNASQILNDGDLVEVDANNGVIKILKKK